MDSPKSDNTRLTLMGLCPGEGRMRIKPLPQKGFRAQCIMSASVFLSDEDEVLEI